MFLKWNIDNSLSEYYYHSQKSENAFGVGSVVQLTVQGPGGLIPNNKITKNKHTNKNQHPPPQKKPTEGEKEGRVLWGKHYLWEFVTNFTNPFTFLPNDCAMKSLLND